MAKHELTANTVVNGEFYAAGTTVSADVARHITNPKVLAQPTQSKSASSGNGSGSGGDGGGDSGYAKQNADDLKAEVERRNAERDDEHQIVVGGKGNKPDVVAALEADDAALAAAAEAGDGGSGDPDPAGD